jgi:putative pyruvate formate lyase activating enzyme
MSADPAYTSLLATGELDRRAGQALDRTDPCVLCPHECRVQRTLNETGRCHTGALPVVCSAHPHFGEEAPLVGRHGSGTIFFSWCNLNCQFCQNCELSAFGEGSAMGPEDLAGVMLELQAMQCHNINLVSPSHVAAQVLQALCIAAERGLRLPLVYNSGGYDAVDTLRLLDGVVDIYMPDMKFAQPEAAKRLSGAPDYPGVNRAAVSEMHRQVGDLVLDKEGVAIRGLLVRHLVLPGGLAGTPVIAQFLADAISPRTYLNVMDQYRPCHRAGLFPPLDRRLTKGEYASALSAAREAGLTRFDSHRT